MPCKTLLYYFKSHNILVFELQLPYQLLFLGHEDCVRDLVEINDEQILSCSNDSTVRRWSVDSGKCLEILTGHPNYVYR